MFGRVRSTPLFGGTRGHGTAQAQRRRVGPDPRDCRDRVIPVVPRVTGTTKKPVTSVDRPARWITSTPRDMSSRGDFYHSPTGLTRRRDTGPGVSDTGVGSRRGIPSSTGPTCPTRPRTGGRTRGPETEPRSPQTRTGVGPGPTSPYRVSRGTSRSSSVGLRGT